MRVVRGCTGDTSLQVNTFESSGEKEAEDNFLECPLNSLICSPDSTDHNLALPSSLLVKILLPSLQKRVGNGDK